MVGLVTVSTWKLPLRLTVLPGIWPEWGCIGAIG